MKRLVILLIACVLLCSSGCKKEETDVTDVEETIAMWISFLEYQENELPLESFVETTVTNCKELGVNTLYVHTSAFTDAFYESKIYDQNEAIVGNDPFAMFVKEGHKQGLKVYAWVNPLRSVEVEKIETLDITKSGSKQLMEWAKTNDERLRQVNGRYYLNPAYQEVVDLVKEVVLEQIHAYKIDGVILDDYFYPDGVDQRFDAYVYSKVLKENEALERSAFRIQATNHLVDELHQTCKQEGLPFGISCSGNIQNNLELLFADPYAWCENKYVDFLAPQIYWGYQHPIKPFKETFEEWAVIAKDIPLMPALAAYKCGVEDVYAKDGKDEWIDHSNMLAMQTKTCLDHNGRGVSYFRYHSMYQPSSGVDMSNEIEALQQTLQNIDRK